MVVERFAGPPSEWDEFVRAQNGWTHCHLAGWRDVIGRAFGHESIYLAARSGSAGLVGVLPLVRVRSRLFGHFLVSMPFLNDGGPLGTEEAVRALSAAAADLARMSRVTLLELRCRRAMPIDLRPSHHKVSMLLPLTPGDPEASWRGFRGKLRSQIRRPMGEGIVVRFGRDQAAPFHRVFSRHMRDLGTPALPRGFFEAVADTFPKDVWFGCAYLGEEPIAAGCALLTDREAEMTWASALREHKGLAANMLLYWAFIERAAVTDREVFSFGRCTPNGGTHRFKAQWGTEERPLWWYQTPEAGRAGTPSPEDPRYQWGPKMWRFLPLPAANVLGPRIVRGIP